MEKSIQIIYAPGTFGNCLRWLIDRFLPDTNFKNINSPWDKDGRAHGFSQEQYNAKIKRGHQVHGKNWAPDPTADKIVIAYSDKDLIFIERCGYYRNVGWENENLRYRNIISQAEPKFIQECFGSVTEDRNVAKEIKKIQFYDRANHIWWTAMEKYMSDNNHYQFDLFSMCDKKKLIEELKNISQKYHLNLDINENIIDNVVGKIKNLDVVITKDRVNQILDAIDKNLNIECLNLDILEQAYIEVELEKKFETIIFPYGTNWFKDTAQIISFLNNYPSYLRQVSPKLPWHNIDRSK